MHENDGLKYEYKKLLDIAEKNDFKINYNLVAYANTIDTMKQMGIDQLLSKLADDGVDVVYETIDVENDAPSMDIKPFDPSLVNIVSPPMTIDSLMKRIDNREIEFDSDFQRKSGLWTQKQKSQLIESILLQIPLPAFYFDATNDDKWIVIDGLQRTTALKEFIVDKTLKLADMEFFHDLNGLNFNALPRSFVRRIEETHILAYKVCSPTPINVKYNIFKRINTGGLTLEQQEIRNALFQGKASRFLKKAAKNSSFISVTRSKINPDRMLDREFVLRFIAFCFYGKQNYKGDIEEYLNDTMAWLNVQDQNMYTEIEKEFNRVMYKCEKIFESYAFQKMGFDKKHRPINKAIYAAWCYTIHNLSNDDVTKLIKRKKSLLDEFTISCENRDDLWKSSDRVSVYKQFDFIKNLVASVLED